FQAEDGIRDRNVTGVQTCALPILSFIIFGIVTFVLAHAILLFGSDFLSIGQFRVPLVWSGAHFLLLEFAVMICMGAMYQLVPVAFLTPIWNQTFGIFQFIVTVIGFLTSSE